MPASTVASTHTRRDPRRFASAVAACAILLASAIAGCSSESTGVLTGAEGTYGLETVNGIALPHNFTDADEGGPFTQTTTSGAVVLSPGNRYSHSVSGRFVQLASELLFTLEERGNYELTGDNIRFISNYLALNGQVLNTSPDTTNAALVGGAITLVVEDTLFNGSVVPRTLVYRKP
jgi:hypothetical protein